MSWVMARLRRQALSRSFGRTGKTWKPGRTADCRARVFAASSGPWMPPHPLRFARSLHDRHAATQPADGAPSTTCAATIVWIVTLVPQPYPHGSEPLASASCCSRTARARWCSTS